MKNFIVPSMLVITILVVSSCFADPFVKQPGTPVNNISKLVPLDGGVRHGEFGKSMAIYGDRLIIGAANEKAYIFDAKSGKQLFVLSDSDGKKSDGKKEDSFGASFVLDLDHGKKDDSFGASVAISDRFAIVGVPGDDFTVEEENAGSIVVFDVKTGNQLFKLTADDRPIDCHLGRSVAVKGKMAVAGASNGKAYVFDLEKGEQTRVLEPRQSAGKSFGDSVVISENLVVVGAPNDDNEYGQSGVGAVYLFDAKSGRQMGERIVAHDPVRQKRLFQSPDHFGKSLAIDGNVLLVGAPLSGYAGKQCGAAYLFDIEKREQIGKLIPKEGEDSDGFGRSVGIAENMAIVGASSDWRNAMFGGGKEVKGSAYLFSVPDGKQSKRFATGEGNDGYGHAVAINEKFTFVAAPSAFGQKITSGLREGGREISGAVFSIQKDGTAASDEQRSSSVAKENQPQRVPDVKKKTDGSTANTEWFRGEWRSPGGMIYELTLANDGTTRGDYWKKSQPNYKGSLTGTLKEEKLLVTFHTDGGNGYMQWTRSGPNQATILWRRTSTPPGRWDGKVEVARHSQSNE